jgi:hypothetical protein
VLRALARRGDVLTRTNGTDVEVKRLEHRRFLDGDKTDARFLDPAAVVSRTSRGRAGG